MVKSKITFLDMFPDHVYRYIDQTGNQRPPVSSIERRDDLNIKGYEAYFTVNGFKNAPNAQKENCSSINSFFVDIDGRKDLQELEDIKKILNPTFILETKNGYHIYWLLDEPFYKEDATQEMWTEIVSKWERIEQNIVTKLKADPAVKDITRILRIPDTYYWKKSGDDYLKGTEGVFKIKGIYKNYSSTYSMEEVDEAFPQEENVRVSTYQNVSGTKIQKYAEQEKKDFFDRVNHKYPIDERPSFLKMISGSVDSFPPNFPSRNTALLITASLMRQAGWSLKKSLEHIEKVGWHGMEAERGGLKEIQTTIESAFKSPYTFSPKNDFIAYNMTDEESVKMQSVYSDVLKDRKEVDKVRFSNYEKELFERYPNLKKNEVGIIFDYSDGVYKMLSDQDVSSLVLNGLYDDLLWGYRTKKNVADKVACLLSIIPTLEISNDGGYIANVKNGLLNINTRELMPHTPKFVSLIQYPVVYDKDAKCPIWDECIKEWMSGEEQELKIKLLQEFSGYCLSSSMLYDKALFLVGDGGNGKSTFADTIAGVIGKEAVSHIDLEGLYGQYGMKGLIGKRINLIEEVQGNFYQSNKLKKLISGEQITIDIKYKDQFTFRPQAKFIFLVNLIPRVDDTSTATERRMCVIHFKRSFKENPNTRLRSSMGLLAQEYSGILNWMLDGAKILAEEKKFVVTNEQNEMLSEYRQENSSVEGFIKECIDFKENESISGRKLYEEYKKWCQLDGRKFKANIVFTKEMKAYGKRFDKFSFKERDSGKDVCSFEGIKLAKGWLNRDKDDWGDYNQVF